MADPVFVAAAAGENGTGGTTVTVNVPAGTSDGDVMIAAVFLHISGAADASASGWNVEHSRTHSAGFDNLTVLSRVASSEPASYAFTLGASGKAVGVIQTWSSVDTTTPVEAEGSQDGSSTAVATAPSITPVTAGAGLIWIGGLGGGSTTCTEPSGYTEPTDNEIGSSGGGAGSTKASIAVAYKEGVAASATGSATGTFGASSRTIGCHIALKPASSGTTFNQNLDGAITPAGALVKQTTKVIAGAVTPAGGLVKQTSRALAGAISPSGALVKQLQRAFSGAISPSGAVVSSLVKVQLVDGVIAPAGALVKTSVKVLAGAASFTGTVVKQSMKVLAGAVNPTGALTKSLNRALSGAVSPAGALTGTKVAVQLLDGVLSFSGALAKQAVKVVGGAVSPAGTVVRSISRALSGAVSPSGALAAARTFFKTVVGAISPSAAVGTTHIPGEPGEPSAGGGLTAVTRIVQITDATDDA